MPPTLQVLIYGKSMLRWDFVILIGYNQHPNAKIIPPIENTEGSNGSQIVNILHNF